MNYIKNIVLMSSSAKTTLKLYPMHSYLTLLRQIPSLSLLKMDMEEKKAGPRWDLNPRPGTLGLSSTSWATGAQLADRSWDP